MVILEPTTNRFAMIRVGVEGYEGEERLWKDGKRSSCRIMARIQKESRLLSQVGVDFYIFLLGGKKLYKKQISFLDERPIDVFFVLIKGGSWRLTDFPSIDLLILPNDSTEYKEFELILWRNIDRRIDGLDVLPRMMRMWGDKGEPYRPGAVISNFK